MIVAFDDLLSLARLPVTASMSDANISIAVATTGSVFVSEEKLTGVLPSNHISSDAKTVIDVATTLRVTRSFLHISIGYKY